MRARSWKAASAACKALEDDEEQYWREQLPEPTALAALDERFPIVRAGTAGTPHDEANFPWGALTSLGMEQLRGVGRGLARRYGWHHGRDTRDPRQRGAGDDDVAAASVSTGDGPSLVSCVASNFWRTQRSAQCLLAGLADEIPPGAWPGHPGPGHVRVRVRGAAVDTINCFDRPSGSLQRSVMAQLEDSSFVEAERAARNTKALLCTGGVPRFDCTFASTDKDGGGDVAGDFFDDELAKMKWIDLYDYLMCRQRPGAPPTLDVRDAAGGHGLSAAELRRAVEHHVCWRFGEWYAHMPTLRLAAGPLLRELTAQMCETATSATDAAQRAQAGAAPGPELHVFGGHDVTVLSLHWALRTALARGRQWWPPYGSNIIFELLQADERTATTRETDKPGPFFVRVVADGRALPLETAGEHAVGAHDATLLPLHRFCAEFATGLAVDEDNGKVGMDFMSGVLGTNDPPNYFIGGC